MVDVPDEETAAEIAERYAEAECTGQFGTVTDVGKQDAEWVVAFETHTFSETYTHRVRITERVGNVIAHERSSRFE
ncbi:hypothetical protein B4589_007265 [Halolamina sp. CBA1230]|uniref:hypothetical protein n=1 Tax=Halolamina sp. CBA1230 TaxID=1853690 RepID=UPI0009A185C2|nr:hypothetical protein [Halolamina sp. CBA1230]QKY20188.1 hypothetical protein B4589_007265 [Halolamina sp. CBA1230]